MFDTGDFNNVFLQGVLDGTGLMLAAFVFFGALGSVILLVKRVLS